MPKVSEEFLLARREEIIDACAKLYETMSFKEITLKEIGKVTSFNRTAIYNYFNTKEEIFLALMQREYERWSAELDEMVQAHEQMTRDELAQALAHSLEKRVPFPASRPIYLQDATRKPPTHHGCGVAS